MFAYSFSAVVKKLAQAKNQQKKIDKKTTKLIKKQRQKSMKKQKKINEKTGRKIDEKINKNRYINIQKIIEKTKKNR